MKVLICVVVLCVSFSTLKALKCYTCSVSQSDLDQRCVTDPEHVEIGSAVTDCNRAYCTSVRTEYVDPPNVVQSMVRSCTDNPLYISELVQDTNYKIYYRACQSELCNSGNGKNVETTSSSSYSDGTVLLVPGIGGASVGQGVSLVLLLVSALYLHLMN